MIKTRAIKSLENDRIKKKGRGLFWHAAKTGKLGLDLPFIIFATVGAFLVPLYFWKR